MSRKKALTTLSLTMINVAAIASLRNLPVMAIHGFQLIFYLALASIFFFLPTALIAAELVAHYPEEGGIYVWVRKAFGKQVGFLAVWLQWIGVVIWYPTSLVFVAATLGMVIYPPLAENPAFIFSVVTLFFWVCTWINFRGMEVSGRITTWGVIAGTLIPGGTIILLGLTWWLRGNPLEITTGWSALFPSHLISGHIPLLCGIAVSFVGMEMSEVHATDVAKPQKTYPMAILASTLAIFGIYALGSLAIAFVLPPDTLSLTSGLISAFHAFLAAYGMLWLKPYLALLMIIGVLTGISTWIVGPSRGLMIAAREGHLPKLLQKRNGAHMPVNIMILQAVIVTLLTSAFLFMPSVHTAFILLTVLGSQVVMVMYALMFIAAIKLRMERRSKAKLFQVPSRFGLWLTAVLGLIGTSTMFTLGFFPPDGVNVVAYEASLWIAKLLCIAFPFIYHQFNKTRLS